MTNQSYLQDFQSYYRTTILIAGLFGFSFGGLFVLLMLAGRIP